jgi:histidinol-phosphatase (PHP family)
MLDYHVHLWMHGHQDSLQATVDQLAAYCEHAAQRGVTEIAITEHVSRFVQVDRVLRGWWNADPDPHRRAEMAGCWDSELGADLDQYMDTVLAAKAAGLPVVAGMEVDYFAGQMDVVAGVLGGYPFDVLLGSVHWIGAWLFDALEWTEAQQQWDVRGVERVWADYTASIEELAASGSVDVLAHPDLVKLAGRVPDMPDEFYDRIAEAAASSGLAAELNSSGLRKPCNEAYPSPSLLRRFRDRDVPITTGADGHERRAVSWRIDEVKQLALDAGYDRICAFRERRRRLLPL